MREHLKARGLDPSRFQDDQQVLDYLVQVYGESERARPYADLGRRYAPYQSHLDQLLAQQAQQQAAPAAQKKWWTAPDYDSSWMSQVDVDEKGNLVPKPGADPMLPQKIAEWRRHQREVYDAFAADPMELLGPGIEERVVPLIQKAIQEHLGQFSDQTFAQQLIQSNADWLYQKDQAGGFLTNPATGRRMLSYYGQRYHQAVNDLAASGVSDVRAQDQLARKILAGEAAMASAAQAQAPGQVNQQIKQDFLGGAVRQPGRNGSAAPPSNPNIVSPPAQGEMTLADMMRKNFQASGITDSVLAQQVLE